MKHTKKMMAIVIAMLMILGMTTSAFAAPNYTPQTNADSTWNGTADPSLSISGLEAADVVTFYQVLEYSQDASTAVASIGTANEPAGYNYKTDGAGGWKLTAQFKDAITKEEFKAILSTGITAEIAGKIAKAATGTGHNETVAEEQSSVTWQEEKEGEVITKPAPNAGLYVAIIAPGKAGVMYNPIFVASDYYTTEDPYDLSSTWAVVETPLSYAGESMAKKSTVTVDKTANDDNTIDGASENYNNKSETVNVGDVIDFTVTTTIPEFGDNYINASYAVSDTLSTGLQLLNSGATGAATNTDYSMVVSITPAKATESGTAGTKTELAPTTTTDEVTTTNYTVTASATGYTITFNKDYLLGLDANTALEITYKAKVLDSAAASSVNQEDNTVVVSFNNNPNDATSKTKLIDKTNHYTFDIDGLLAGGEGTPWQTQEVVKVGLDEDGNEIKDVTTTLHEGQKSVGALSGAKFKLYKDNGNGAKGELYTNSILTEDSYIESNANGLLTIHGQSTPGIRGLDAGTYWLEETEAPAGYIRAQEPVKIEIIPTFTEKTETVIDGNDELTVTVKELLSYVVKIGGETTATYNLTNDPDGDITSVNQGDTVVGGNGYIGDTGSTDTADDGKIVNTRGTELPSTGGIGTIIFYVVGTILVLGCGIVLISRRRLNANK